MRRSAGSCHSCHGNVVERMRQRVGEKSKKNKLKKSEKKVKYENTRMEHVLLSHSKYIVNMTNNGICKANFDNVVTKTEA